MTGWFSNYSRVLYKVRWVISRKAKNLRACWAGTEGGSTVPFRYSFAYKNCCPSVLKMGQKRSLCMGERNGTVPTEQALSSSL